MINKLIERFHPTLRENAKTIHAYQDVIHNLKKDEHNREGLIFETKRKLSDIKKKLELQGSGNKALPKLNQWTIFGNQYPEIYTIIEDFLNERRIDNGFEGEVFEGLIRSYAEARQRKRNEIRGIEG